KIKIDVSRCLFRSVFKELVCRRGDFINITFCYIFVNNFFYLKVVFRLFLFVVFRDNEYKYTSSLIKMQ
ncbi:hypothetical protein, partial [Bacillus mycoides]|uniref:hypothetical protein n=1 Tax=Bacillus mycoides TaxID=1405 RepID=UPI001C92E0E6